MYPWLYPRSLVALLSSALFLFDCIVDRPKRRPYIVPCRDVLGEYWRAITHSGFDQIPRYMIRPGVMLSRLGEECEHDSRACNALDANKWPSRSKLDGRCSICGMSYTAESTGTLSVLVLPAIMKRTRVASENSKKEIPLSFTHTDQTRACSIQDHYE